MLPKEPEQPFELVLDRIAIRYHVLPWEVEKGSLEWLETISAIMKLEAERQQQIDAKERRKAKLKAKR